MQQDRSTGWRLGSNRVTQFRYQAIGIAAGAVLAVLLAKLFMSAFPILTQDQFANPHLPGAEKWQSAFTFKMVGALRGITQDQPHVMKALLLGIGLGLGIESMRKLLKLSRAKQELATAPLPARTRNFVLDAILLPSPYAFAFGGFVEFITVVWWTIGGVGASIFESWQRRRGTASADLPADMSSVSLVGGGQIAGDALAALTMGIYGLLRTIL